MSLNQLLLESAERRSKRNWAQGLAKHSVSVDTAIANVAAVLRDQLLEHSVSPLRNLEVMLLLLDEWFGTLAPTPDKVTSAIKAASRSYYAFQAAECLAHLTSSQRGLYPDLDQWRDGVFLGLIQKPPCPRGQNPYTLRHRDTIFVNQLKQLEHLGFNPTGSAASKERDSGCGIVSAATFRINRGQGKGYDAIERVWKRSHKVRMSAAFAQEIAELIVGGAERRTHFP